VEHDRRVSGFVGLNSERVRRDNLSAVLREVHRRGAVSRSELALHTSLYRQTIRSLVRDLEARGLVTEHATASEGAPGRPSLLVAARPDLVRALAIDIEVDSIGLGLVALGGQMLRSGRVPRTRRAGSAARSLAAVAAEVERFLAPEDLATIRAVGVAIVGIVRRGDGLVRLAPNLGWHDLPLADALRARLRLGPGVPIVVGNEADLGGLAEHVRGAAAGFDNMVYLSGEVGLGGGVVVDGRPLVGSGGYAGEIGHIVVSADGLPCGCGSTGCWETEVGEASLLRRAGVHGSGSRERQVAQVIAEALRGEPVATAAVEDLGRWMGIGLTGLVNVFNPQVVVFGGLFERLFPVMLPAVRAELERRVTPALLEGLEIRPSRFGSEAPLIGAAELALEGILADPLSLSEVIEGKLPGRAED
jgi:predicted NBD/HSP70 family sugar kinase